MNLYPNRRGTKLTLGLHLITKRRLGLCMPYYVYDIRSLRYSRPQISLINSF